ncbi:hypothetical protein [Ruminococcus flavefaciens]|uniref:hypothetical protein n=1 Tax=Ruminococcus flavefaciens TaxID=1265 RepID=UPI0026F27A6E|nr:hypothetical protein [Ruminococcus flavefaciens]MBQ6211951.1 hypothetical protein [Ruminococcus sp.]
MNPMNLIKLRSLFDRFKENHPKVPLFFKAAVGSVREGSIIEIKVIPPESDKQTIITNLKVNSEDIALFEELKEMT